MNVGQHSRAARTRIWLALAPGGGAATLKGALMAMGLIPQPLPLDPGPRQRALATLADGALAFIDVSAQGLHGRRPLQALLQAVPDAAGRSRVLLSRTQAGHVSPQDRRWMQQLGFADLVSDWAGGARHLALQAALAWAARLTGVDEPAPQAVLTTARVFGGDSGLDAADAARATVWGLTGDAPESFAARLPGLLDVADRRWHFTDYPRCFIGREAVACWTAALGCGQQEALALGQAMGVLGLIGHVVHEHPFQDEALFYRLAWSHTLDAIDADRLWQTVEAALPGLTAQRSYLGTAYPQCFVGAELVGLLARQHGLHRVDAWLALQRMAQWGWIEHVTRDRPFIDGPFFYRWRWA